MTEKFPSWLTKQMVQGVRGDNLDAYLMALEGWRRGLSLRWYLDPSKMTDMKIIGHNPPGKTYSLSSENKTHFFNLSRGDQVSDEAVKIGTNKQVTKEKLNKAGIPIPEGKGFNSETSIDEIVNYGLSLGFPLIVKPTFSSSGKGVFTNITTEEKLRESIEHTQEIGYEEIIVERYIQGNAYRIYVVDEAVVGATERLPANVVGDGVKSIKDLIDMKNNKRKNNPYLRTKLIKIDENLKSVIHKNDYTLDNIPAKDKLIYLREISNISAGGDPIEVIDKLSPKVKDIAIGALKSIPGLTHAGIDLLVDENSCIVTDIDPTADISMHIFPIEGNPVNIPELIINKYFPETSNFGNRNVYFNYNKIHTLLNKGIVEEILVNDLPKKHLYAKKYIVSGDVQKVGYRRWVRREARKKRLHGYVKNLKDGKVKVVVGSHNQTLIRKFKEVCYTGSRRSSVENIKEYDWNSELNVGFEIREDEDSESINIEKNKKQVVSLTAVGDILLHGRVYGGLRKNSGYKFDEQLANAKEVLGQTDITIANLESIIAGQDIGLSAFPRFNAPVEIGYTLKDLGIDILSIANNHILDRGEKGLLKSIKNIEKIGFEYVGAYKSFKDRDRLRIVEKNGMKICFMSYTSGTNGIKIPSEKPYLVNSLRATSSVKICRLLRKIKREGIADAIVLNLHFGREYHLHPTRAQKELATSLADAGADVIIGHHPHVLQPPEWIETSLGTRTFVAYSLGNFFSGQNGLYRQIGASLSLKINRPDPNYKGIIIEDPKLDLTYVNREERLRYDLYLMRDWINKNETILTDEGIFDSKKVYKDVITRMKSKIPELYVQ